MLYSAIAVVFVLDFMLYATCGLHGCPDPARLVAYQPGGASVLLDRHGRKFADLAPVEREMVRLANLPDFVAEAFIAVEDKRFYKHHGVDWVRVFGAAVRNMASGEIDQGSSTITMQLSRNVFSDRLKASDKTLRRKLFEARVAKRIEHKFSKREILELYLNHIYFGGGAYGIQSASRYYFGKPASKLKLHEAAMLAAMPKAPAHYNPRTHATRAKQRRNYVLEVMKQQGFIDAEAASNAQERRLGVTDEPPGLRGAQPLGAYFAQLVRNELEDRIGDDIYTKKLRIRTTLDINAQKAAEEELAKQIRFVESGALGTVRGPKKELQGAVVVMESATGDILALVGGRDIRQSRWNHAILARRQAGSAFKPFVYAAAIEEGYPASQPVLDAPVRLASQGRQWEPRNYDDQFYGMLSMRSALAYSRNIPSVRLAAAVGNDHIKSMARAAGITGEVRNTPMVALGITEVTPIELTTAIGTFGGMGTRAEPRFVVRVENELGDVIYANDIKTEQRIDPAVAYVVTDMLIDAVDYGTATSIRSVGFDGPVAGKTGTTSDGADVWFVGYTPDVVAGVWVGYDERRPLPSHASGGSVSAPVFGRIMRRLYTKRPMPSGFTMPDGVVTRFIDPESGQVLEEGCYPNFGNPSREVFLRDAVPETICPRHESENIFEALGNFLGQVFAGDNAPPEPEPGVRADGSRDVLGAGRIAKRQR